MSAERDDLGAARRSRRALACALVVGAVSSASCVSEDEGSALEDARAFVSDARVRRAALLRSVADHDTPYAERRLMHYALSAEGVDSEDDWDRLPEFAPRVREVFVDGAEGEAGPIAETDLGALDAVIAAGERAFDRYPAQLDLSLAQIRTRAEAERVGLYVEPSGRVRGLVEAETVSGWVPALTCSGCHGRFDGEAFLLGVPNERLAIGDARWPLGTMDVTDDGLSNPTRPSDLRPLALQARLHHAGNLENGRLERMVRIETLLVTQQRERLRPNRTLVAAMALYLESLADTLPALDTTSTGGQLFARECARCHASSSLAGAWTSIAEVGTDPLATMGERGTGGYRAPSLLGVSDRRGVLHDGSAADLRAILHLDPSEHVGHAFGLDLSVQEREAILRALTGP